MVLLCNGCFKNNKHYLSDNEIEKIKKTDNIDNIFREKFVITLSLTNDKKSIVNFRGVEYNGKFIYTSGYLWNAKGEFIANVGAVGKGPGEYISVRSAFFYGDDKIGLLDNPRNMIVLYQIDEINKKVTFIDNVNLEDIDSKSKYSPTSVDFIDNKFIVSYLSGIKGQYQIVILDNNFKIIKKLHKSESQYSGSRNFNLSFTKKHIYISDIANHAPTFNSSFIYFYDTDGNLILKINSYTKRYIFERDASGKLLFVINFEKNKMFLLSHNSISQQITKKSKDKNEIKWVSRMINRFEAGQYHEYIVAVEKPENKDTGAILHFYQYDLGLDPLNE